MFCDMELVKVGDGPDDHNLSYHDRCSPSFTKRQQSLTSQAGFSITVLIQAGTDNVFYNNPAELAYICFEIGHTVLYTILVTYRLFVMRERMRQIMAQYDSRTYNTVALMVIESAAFYAVFAIAFMVAFAVHAYGLTTMCFLSIGKIQVSKRNSSCLGF
jgi:hypothetical protein